MKTITKKVINKVSQRKPNRAMTYEEFEAKITNVYLKANPQPKDLKEKVELELHKLKK